MSPINALKKCFFDTLVPHIDTNKKKNNFSEEQRFRDLFKKGKSSIIFVSFLLFLLLFGIAKSFSIFIWLIVCSPFFVIFWSSFGEQLIGKLKFKKFKK